MVEYAIKPNQIKLKDINSDKDYVIHCPFMT